MREMLTKALVAVLLTWAGSWASDGSPPRPNIVLLLADDLGYGDLGCYGHERVSTPNIDGLARDGLRFTRMYSQTVCTPSRGAILTGRYPIRFGLIRDTSPFQYALKSPVFVSHAQPGGIPDSERPVLPEMLASKGYRKAFIGKWHLGSGHQRQHLPLKYGFDFFYGIPDTHFFGCTKDPKFRWTDADFFVARLKSYQRKLTALVALIFTLWYVGFAGKRTIAVIITGIAFTLLLERIYLSFLAVNPKSCILLQNNTIVEQPYNDDLLPPRLTRKALEFISRSAENDKPFFLFMSYPQVHLPPIVSERFRNRSGLGPYYDSVTEMDWSVGKIVSLLKKRDVYKNTLIIFASDNGPEHYNPLSGNLHDAVLRGSTTFKVSRSPERIELLGAKEDVWEGGIRVPAIFVWPGVIAPGTESHHVASFIDIYPTICEVLNEKCPGKKFDGRSLVPRFTDATSSSLHQYLMHHCDNGGVSAVTANRYKAHFRSCKAETFDPPLLFDIEKDPGESKPLDTDISKYQSVLIKIRQAVERHESSLESFPMQLGRIARPWFFLCDNPPFCSKSLDENDRFSDLYSE